MTKSKIVFACISLGLVLRIILGRQSRVVEGTRLEVSIPTIDIPEYSDGRTIVKRGEWVIEIPGYTDYIPGDIVMVEGEYVRGKVKAEKSKIVPDQEIGVIDQGLIMISRLRAWATHQLQRLQPEPMASLAIGILLGVRREMPNDFYQALVKTGTLHIVAASGYNVGIVASLGLSLVGRVWSKRVGVMFSLLGIGVYVLLVGGSPSIVRAGIMGSLTLIAFYWGRPTEARWLLGVTIYIMLMLKPTLIGDIGWQLSVASTLGLLYIVPWLTPLFRWQYVKDYVVPTLAATIATMPIIWWHFGRVSLIGIGVNALILPAVPIVMLLAALTLVLPIFAFTLYVPLWFMVTVIKLVGV